MNVSAAQPHELAPAFRLLFSQRSLAEQDGRLRTALHLVQTGDLDPQGIFVIRDIQGVTGVVVCQPVIGAAALIWPPVVLAGGSEAEDALLDQALAWLRRQGMRLVQALLPDEEAARGASLLRHGFYHITDLQYLRHDLHFPPGVLRTPTRLTFESYDPEVPEEFHQTLQATYEGTLDCPEVNGVRSVEEVIAGHKAQGRFDPETWWLARWGTQPAGVMILIELPESGDFEVAYMGLVPAARGKGLGQELLLHALCEAKAMEAAYVTLSVDARNQPAAKLYRRVGFRLYDRRQVFLLVNR